ncbi:MAG: hypothetical protein IIC02_13790 [Planctomycetes bacterium]|nr:hypothetical protein [Planctomycetota bacterium]
MPFLPVVLRDTDLTADPEPILYDERNPQSAVVLRHIPGHIEVDDDGRLTEGRQTEGFFKPYNDLWIPVLCVGAWWLFLCRRGRVSSWTRRGFHRFRGLGS